MFRFLREWSERRVLERAEIAPAEWEQAFAALPLLDGLDDDECLRLMELTVLFLHRKTFEGARGLEVTRRMQLVIALQACLPILELGLDCYDGWTAVIVYPSGFARAQTFVDEFGIEHEVHEELSGEAWERGPVVLAWDDAARGGYDDGYNPVIHEFAHKLDLLNGDDNGFPPLHADMDVADWSRVFSAGYDDFCRRSELGEDLGIDDYAATAPGEFFAVLSEVFFETPDLLQASYPDIYQQLRRFYRQDPLARLR